MKNSNVIKTGLIRSAVYATLVMGSFSAFNIAQADTYAGSTQSAATQTMQKEALSSGAFVKKQKSLKGDWQVVEENGQTIIRFAENFKTKNGPDLKIFLSPQSLTDVNGHTATNGAVLLGTLKSTRGGQDYIVPEGVSLANFNSVLVHCEAFSVLWGGGAL